MKKICEVCRATSEEDRICPHCHTAGRMRDLRDDECPKCGDIMWHIRVGVGHICHACEDPGWPECDCPGCRWRKSHDG